MGTFRDWDGDGKVTDDWVGSTVGAGLGMWLGSELVGPVGGTIGGNVGWAWGNTAVDYFDDLTGADGAFIVPEQTRNEQAERAWKNLGNDAVPIVPPHATSPASATAPAAATTRPEPTHEPRREVTITHIDEPTIEPIPPGERTDR